MFRLIFVDDEAIIRDGISQCVAWGENGFELAGMFENGQQALDYIKENPVDVVITDINMPRMDGLTLSKIINESFPKITVLLLTGYDDFEYAQKAVKSQVREFLLKPITAEELKNVLALIGEELILSRDQEKEQEVLREKLRQSFPLLKERFLNRLVSGRLNRDNFLRRKEYFQWNDRENLYLVSVIGIPEGWDEMERLILQEHIRAVIEPDDEVFFNTGENLVLIFQGDDEDSLEKRVSRMLETFFQFAGNQEKEQITAGCGEVVCSHSDLPRSYSGASTAVDYSKVLGLTQILFIKDVRKPEENLAAEFQILCDDLAEQLKEGKKEYTLEALNKIFDLLEKHYISHNMADVYFSRVHFLLYNFLMEMGILTKEDSFFPQKPNYYSSIGEARKGFLLYGKEIEDRIDSRRNDIIFSRVDKAKEIIAMKYGNSKFSLQDICSDLYLSTSQFSFLFKEGTGQTFIEYLTAFRIEEAKKLLKTTDLKAYEIAEQVGYQDSRYFSLIFKKQTGSTAMEFRKKLES